MKTLLRNILALSSLLLLPSCDPPLGGDGSVSFYDLDGFIKQHNTKIENWLEASVKSTEEAKKEKVDALAKLNTPNTGDETAEVDPKIEVKRRALTRDIAGLDRALAKLKFRQECGDYFQFKSPEDIPQDLVWETGMDEPEIGDPLAKKGGVYNTFIQEFPETLRPFGPSSNHSFRGKLYDEIDMATIGLHPVTNKPIPALANQWAVSKDRRTVYYKINPKARYSNGEQIKAKDFMTDIYVKISPNVYNPYAEEYYKDNFANITVYDDLTLSVTIPEVKPDPYYSTALRASCPSFYKEYGPDYRTRYQWRVPPATGAYDCGKEDIKKGRSITVRRVKDWWAKDMKYYRYRFNVDAIRYLVVRDVSKSFELFKIGEIDAFWVHSPEYWYDKTEIEPVFDGYIEKKKFYTNFPMVPWGIYLNVDEGILRDKNVRLGIQHAMNFNKVNEQIFRGDYVRIDQFSDGFGRFTDQSIKAREFNPKKAREYFAKAGFKEEDDAGYLVNEDGTRLSIICTVTKTPQRVEMLNALKKTAKDCGLEFKIDALESSVAFAKTSKKEHQACYGGWGVQPPTPVYHQFFHSKAAFDETGERNSSSNNQNVFADEKMDVLAEQVRDARTYEELQKAAFAAQKIVHDEAIFVPAVGRDYTAIAHWRWMKWPKSKTTNFSYPIMYEPMETYLFWIDQDVKEETLKARRNGDTFPEVEEVIDEYRNK